jgi:hypothetical protein
MYLRTYTIGNHCQNNYRTSKNVKELYNIWKELYKKDKSAHIRGLFITIYPENYYSLTKDIEKADREREYFKKQMNQSN